MELLQFKRSLSGLAVIGGAAKPKWLSAQDILGAKLLGQFAGDKSSSLTLSGASVTSWTCLITGLAIAPGTAGTRPVYNSAGFLTFDGVDDYLSAPSNPYFSGAATGEIFVVANNTALPADTGLRIAAWIGGTTSIATSRALGRSVVSAVNRAYARVGNGSGNAAVNATAGDFSGKHRVACRVEAATTYVNLDGGAEASASIVPSTTTAATVIGQYGLAGSGFWQGGIYTVLFTSPLTSGERAALNALYS